MSELQRPGRIGGLIGVYDADGTLRGEIAYWIGARLGTRHCSLCEITHGMVRVRSEWTACRAALPVPFDTYHRNDQPAEVRTASGDRAPTVVAVTDRGVIELLGPAAIEACEGSVEALLEAIEGAAAAIGLTWSVQPDA